MILAGTALGLAGIIASDGGAAFGYGQIMRGLGWFAAGVGLYRTGWRPPSIWPLDTRLARWLGDISYPLYLIHFAPMLALCGCEHPTSWSTAAVGIPASFALAVALHYAVEVPARRWLRSIRLRRTVYA